MKTKPKSKPSTKTLRTQGKFTSKKNLAIIIPGILVVALAGWLIKTNSFASVPPPEASIPRTPGPFAFFSQHSNPWGTMMFKGSPHQITSSGCGLTSYSMIAATMLNNKNLTPGVYATAFKKSGGTLTDHQRGLQVAAFGKSLWGLNYSLIDGVKLTQAQQQSQIRTALKSGKMMLAGGGNGEPYRYFPGHIIVLRSIDSSNMVSVADPWDNSFVHHSYKLSEITKYGSYYVAVSY